MVENNTRKNRGRHYNAWKVAFFVLVGLIVLAGGWLIWKISAPTADGNTKESAVSQPAEGITLYVSLDNKEISSIVNEYLSNSKDYSGYTLEITDRVALQGKTGILGLSVPFALVGDPFVTTEGNLQLKVDSISLGGLPLPKKESLRILAGAIAFPDAFSIQPEEGTVVILLNKIPLPREMSVRLINIDEQTKEYSLEVTIPVENLIE
jgi:uncharacterized protein YpmS